MPNGQKKYFDTFGTLEVIFEFRALKFDTGGSFTRMLDIRDSFNWIIIDILLTNFQNFTNIHGG